MKFVGSMTKLNSADLRKLMMFAVQRLRMKIVVQKQLMKFVVQRLRKKIVVQKQLMKFAVQKKLMKTAGLMRKFVALNLLYCFDSRMKLTMKMTDWLLKMFVDCC